MRDLGGWVARDVGKGPVDVFLCDCALRDTASGIDFGCTKGGSEEAGAPWLCDGHSADLPILSGEQHD